MKQTKSRYNNKKQGAAIVTIDHATAIPPPQLSPESVTCSQSLANQWYAYLKTQKDLYQFLGTYEAPATTDGAGIINQVFGSNPASVLGWSSFTNLFDEFRILACKLEFRPLEFNGTAVTQAPIATVIDYNSPAALTSYNSGTYFSSYKESVGGKPLRRDVTLDGVEDAGFQSVLSPTNTFYIKTYSSGNTATTTVGRWVFSYLMQFRSRGI